MKLQIVAFLTGSRTPDQTIEKIIEYCRIYPISRFAFEKNQFQEIMLDNLTKRARVAGVRFNPRPINSQANKQARIAGLGRSSPYSRS